MRKASRKIYLGVMLAILAVGALPIGRTQAETKDDVSLS
jgi:hypothetical protein